MMNGIFMSDETYINGRFIGALTEEEVSNFDAPRQYVIPPSFLKSGLNLIFIRIGVYGEWDAAFSGDVRIVNPKDMKQFGTVNTILFETLPFAIFILIAAICFSLIVKFLFNRTEYEHLLLSFRLILVMICYATLFSPLKLFNIPEVIGIWEALLCLYFLCLIYYYQTLFHLYFNFINFLLIPAYIGTSLLLLFGRDILLNFQGDRILLGIQLIPAYFCFAYIHVKAYKYKRENYKFILSLSDITLNTLNIFTIFIFIVFDTAVFDPSLVVILVTILLSIIFCLYYIKREKIMLNRLTELTAVLKRIEEKKKQINISETVEEKLQQIIRYLKNNYTSIIYREELAKAAGVNPNYFSTLFNAHTGMKLGDYVNDLRILEAKKQLEITEKSIIDIAFSVGFESLPTFNRVFKRTTGISPRDFRKKPNN
ncbi:MAG: helix-turn-helix transcriptional regulator [Spirochaetales bacterium]|nr:helix-turn-helix transcriptional regulator [Spirochaetales bacterium]